MVVDSITFNRINAGSVCNYGTLPLKRKIKILKLKIITKYDRPKNIGTTNFFWQQLSYKIGSFEEIVVLIV